MTDRVLVIGKGHYERVRPGVYRIRHNIGKDAITGKYRRSPWRFIRATKKSEIIAALEEYKRELNGGVAVRPATITVVEYARNFHQLREGTMRSPLAYKREALEIEHIEELFPEIGLQDLRPFHIKNAYAKARKRNRFSEGELVKIHRKLKQIMQEAVRDELIAKNPCDVITVKKPPAKPREALSAREASRLLACLESSPVDAHIIATMLLLDTGMRRGEVMGLTWNNFDAERGTIRITQQYAADLTLRPPKSKTSRRLIALSSRMTETLSLWKTSQAEDLGRYALIPDDQSPIVHVIGFSESGEGRNTNGNAVKISFMNPNNYSRWFRDFCADNGFGSYSKVVPYTKKDANGKPQTYEKRTGYSGLTPHMLRHTQATLLIGANTDIKTVQTRLGHSSVNLTLDTYSHAIEANDRIAADTFSSLLAQTDEDLQI